MEDGSPYDISVTRVAGRSSVRPEGLVRAVAAALRGHRRRRACVRIALVDDATIAGLNEQHLGHAGPTDVITFDLRDVPDGPIDGEIVISLDTARREAQARGHALSAELALYAVHGTLHLLGYDDHNARDAARMHEREDEILSGLGTGPVYRSGVS